MRFKKLICKYWDLMTYLNHRSKEANTTNHPNIRVFFPNFSRTKNPRKWPNGLPEFDLRKRNLQWEKGLPQKKKHIFLNIKNLAILHCFILFEKPKGYEFSHRRSQRMNCACFSAEEQSSQRPTTLLRNGEREAEGRTFEGSSQCSPLNYSA